MAKRRRLTVEHHVSKPKMAWKKPLAKLAWFAAFFCGGAAVAIMAGWLSWGWLAAGAVAATFVAVQCGG